jgi:hypothetical protein
MHLGPLSFERAFVGFLSTNISHLWSRVIKLQSISRLVIHTVKTTPLNKFRHKEIQKKTIQRGNLETNKILIL